MPSIIGLNVSPQGLTGQGPTLSSSSGMAQKVHLLLRGILDTQHRAQPALGSKESWIRTSGLLQGAGVGQGALSPRDPASR